MNELHSYFRGLKKVCLMHVILMEETLTSVDLVQGHSNLVMGQFETSTKGHYKTHRHLWLLLQAHICGLFKISKVKVHHDLEKKVKVK